MKILVLYDINPAWEEFEIADSRNSNKVLYESLIQEGFVTCIEELNHSDLNSVLTRYNPADTLIFNQCETIPGIQGSEKMVLETISGHRFTYTGNEPDILEISYDKQKVKEILAPMGVPVPVGSILTPEMADTWNIFPAIVKPSHEHCSLTITEQSVVFDCSSLKEQIQLINKQLKQPALVEDFIDGREFHVSVWNNQPPEMLPVAEMDFSAFMEARKRLCTYDSKFIPGSEHYQKIETLLPAPLNETQLAELKKTVVTAWKGLGCRDYARFDLRLRDDRFFLLDINPNNDISFDTSFAMAAEMSGYSYGQMAKRIVEMAVARHPGS
jgi:D-alanine-D-alanine ligase